MGEEEQKLFLCYIEIIIGFVLSNVRGRLLIIEILSSPVFTRKKTPAHEFSGLRVNFPPPGNSDSHTAMIDNIQGRTSKSLREIIWRESFPQRSNFIFFTASKLLFIF